VEIARRVQMVKESPTLAIAAKAQRMKAQGIDVIALATGEPDFDTPEPIKAAAIQAIHDGFTKYTPVAGIPALRQAVQAKFQRDNGLAYSVEQVLVSVGAKQSLYNLCQAYLNDGDEVIVPAPYWVSYPDMVLLAGAKPVIVPCGIEQHFKLTPSQLAAAITPRSKMLILNSPSNPTGAVYSEEAWYALGEVLKQHPQLLIVTDDIYEHILLGNTRFCHLLNVHPELMARTVVVNGVSKAYAMTGWRIGYAAGPRELIQAMEIVQSQSTSNPSAIAQMAALAALNGEQGCIKPMVAAFNQRHDAVLEALQRIPGLHCLPAGGAFYAFVDARQAIQRLWQRAKITEANDLALGNYLLEQHHVAVVPGSAFGAEGYMRLSFATSMEKLSKAMQRIEQALV